MKLSFWVAHLLAKQGKPFTNGDLIKSGMTAAAKVMCPREISLLKNN